MISFHHLLNRLDHSAQKAVLATIIHVEGSAYRKEGAAMLFLEDGTRHGLLSAGCLEADLEARAQELMEDGASQVINYDMRSEDDLGWGQGTGCNGVVQVLLEPVSERLRSDLIHLKRILDQGMSAVLLKKICRPGGVNEYMFLTEHGQTYGTWRGNLPANIRNWLNQVPFVSLRAGTSLQVESLGPGWSATDIPESNLFYLQKVLPASRAILIGAGPDAVPLAAFAAQTGFSVTVVDMLQSARSPSLFPQASVLTGREPLLLLEQLKLTKRDSVIVMTHQFQHDKEWLHLLMQQELLYLGVLGPRERTSRLLGGMEIPERFHAPVGLPIGAEGPEEIAVSIVADLIFHQKRVL